VAPTARCPRFPQSIAWGLLLVALVVAFINPVSPNAPEKKLDLTLGTSPIKDLPIWAIRSPSEVIGIAPADFVKELAKRVTPECTLCTDLDHWITKKDIPALLALVDSKEPCSPVASWYSSYYSTTAVSTIGDQALFMLEGYREGKYPTQLNMFSFPTGKERDELIAWARAQE
jgi:hypothetical protein